MTDPIAGRITSRFGQRVHPVTHKKSFHNGIDIACRIGTPVKAPCNGEISDISVHPTGGLSLIMLSEDFRFGFAHLSDYIPLKGQKVTEGEIIAYSGDTGKTTGPHLHFTVTKKGTLLDPLTIFFK